MALKASPESQALLLDLQAVDTKLAQLTHRAKALPQHAAIAKLTAEMDELRITALAQSGAAEDVQIEIGRIESDVAVVAARIKRDTERSQASTSAKDAQAFEHELANLAKRQYDLEEIELTVMEKLEEREAALAATTAQIESLQTQIDAIVAERDAELIVLEKDIADTRADRATVAGTIPADLLALYDKLRLQKNGVGAAELRQRRCTGCQLGIDFAELAVIKAAPADLVVRCEECSRILVRTPESGI